MDHERIAAGAAGEDVVRRAAVDPIVAVVAGDDVGEIVAARGRAGAAEKGEIFNVGGGSERISVLAIGVDGVDAGAGIFHHGVGVIPHEIGVVAETSDKRDVGRAGRQLVIARRAGKRAAFLLGRTPCRRRARHRKRPVEFEVLGAQSIAVDIAQGQRLAACKRDRDVGAGLNGRRPERREIAEPIALEAKHIAAKSGLEVGYRLGAFASAQDEHVGFGSARKYIVAGAGVDDVRACGSPSVSDPLVPKTKVGGAEKTSRASWVAMGSLLWPERRAPFWLTVSAGKPTLAVHPVPNAKSSAERIANAMRRRNGLSRVFLCYVKMSQNCLFCFFFRRVAIGV